ncbi:MAG: hypothetical protein M3548_02145, partial [Actinomycetota bacterium]|nr:hypothetical protein [Actinomycetota bacterium]
SRSSALNGMFLVKSMVAFQLRNYLTLSQRPVETALSLADYWVVPLNERPNGPMPLHTYSRGEVVVANTSGNARGAISYEETNRRQRWFDPHGRRGHIVAGATRRDACRPGANT